MDLSSHVKMEPYAKNLRAARPPVGSDSPVALHRWCAWRYCRRPRQTSVADEKESPNGAKQRAKLNTDEPLS